MITNSTSKAILITILLIMGSVASVRVLVGTAQRVACHGEPAASFLLSLQNLGAEPSLTECLGLALSRPAEPQDGQVPADTAPLATEPEPMTTVDPADLALQEAETTCGERYDGQIDKANAAYDKIDAATGGPTGDTSPAWNTALAAVNSVTAAKDACIEQRQGLAP